MTTLRQERFKPLKGINAGVKDKLRKVCTLTNLSGTEYTKLMKAKKPTKIIGLMFMSFIVGFIRMVVNGSGMESVFTDLKC